MRDDCIVITSVFLSVHCVCPVLPLASVPDSLSVILNHVASAGCPIYNVITLIPHRRVMRDKANSHAVKIYTAHSFPLHY